ncbi:MAG: hypothetical protein M3245_01965, partial [Actinomycetota bacterium]|nr:hypothetical protein [Actinomycetota bacterium]
LDRRSSRLDERQQDLRRREEAVGIQEKAIESSSFDDGRYQVGTDITAGMYRAPGGEGCYWAKLGTSDGDDIQSNHFGPGPQTLVIDSPWFETSGCGTWKPA